jgi:Protein of unknown function (DUF3800)
VAVWVHSSTLPLPPRGEGDSSVLPLYQLCDYRSSMVYPPDSLSFSSGTLMVFCDETGDENYADAAYPIFGRGGCVVMGSEYHSRVELPWKKLLQRLDWGPRPFHTSEFVQRLRKVDRPTAEAQIEAINQFARHGFYRFGITTHGGTERPENVDGHQVVSMALANLVQKIAATSMPTSVAFIFEDSNRSNKLVRRDFHLENLSMCDLFGYDVPVDGFFMPKSARSPGLELADLIAHTAGDNQRHALWNRPGFPKSFQELFQRAGGAGRAFYWRIETVRGITPREPPSHPADNGAEAAGTVAPRRTKLLRPD